MRRVCIIGAGVAGIVAARYLKEVSRVTLYEASSCIGGVWLYTKDKDVTKHTPMYKNLRTNLPKQLMTFRDLQHETNTPTFLTHQQVMDYIHLYCDKFNINDLISFNTPVTCLRPDTCTDPVKWIVSTGNG